MNKTLIIGLLLLTGCVTNEEQCQKWGAEPGTDAYVNCMATLAQRDAVNDAALSASINANNQAAAARSAAIMNSGPVGLALPAR